MKKAARATGLFALLAAVFLAGSWYNPRTTAGNGFTGGRKVLYYVDPMHPAYRSAKRGIAPDCGMQLQPVYAEGGVSVPDAHDGVSISSDKLPRIGVRVSTVEKASAIYMPRLFGRVVPDEARTYRLTAGVDGWIEQVSPVTTGARVRKGQWLATFSASDVFLSGQAYVVALNAMDRLKENGMTTPLEINPANSNFHQRIEKLQSLGMSATQIEEVARTRQIPRSIKIFAPADGFVLARDVSPGQRFEKGAEWYRIADLSRVWILADVFQKDAAYVRPGQKARVSLPGEGNAVTARVSEILPQFDAQTRTLKVRLEMENPGYTLRPDTFVDVQLPVELAPAITVPVDAVIDSGLTKTVFVERSEGLFEPRRVETGFRFDGRVAIIKGLEPGERIVTSGNFLLDSESRMKQAF